MPLSWVSAANGSPELHKEIYDEWVLAAQDCELAWSAITDNSSDTLVELRPVLREDPPSDWGIRSQRFLIDGTGAYIDSNSPRLSVHPNVLAHTEHLTCPMDSRRLKTWLGLRYDRPAIPQEYIELAEFLVKKVKAKRNRPIAAKVRDLLATFDTSESGNVVFEFVAVLASSADDSEVEQVLDWISAIALEVPESFGVAKRIDARPDTQVSLAFIEKSYALNASSLSWPSNKIGPVGEFRP